MHSLTKYKKDMTTTEFVKLSYQEFMALNQEERIAYKEAEAMDFYKRVKSAIENGFTHIQIGHTGCIKVRKNEYAIRYGKGTGSDLQKFSDLLSCTNEIYGGGWGAKFTCK